MGRLFTRLESIKHEFRTFGHSGPPALLRKALRAGLSRISNLIRFWSLRQLADPQNDDCESCVKYQKGFSLIELLIALAISSIIVIVVIGVINLALKRSQGGFESYKAQTEAQAIMNRMAKEIRQATTVVDAQAQSITFREYVLAEDPAPSQVRFYLNGATLSRGEIPPTGSGPDYTYDPASETTKVLSLQVVNGADPIFSYFDQDGIELTAPVTLAAVTLVSINLSFEQSGSPNPFKVSTKVQLRFHKTNL